MLHPYIVVRNAKVIEGRGLVSTGLIRKGELVSRLEPNQPKTEIAEILTWSKDAQEEFLFHSYQCSETQYVSEEGIERFMNHSCDPNTWWADDDTMIARRDIRAGEEITYDYSTTEVAIDFQMECHCGAAICRGVVTNRDFENREWQERFGEHLPAHTRAAIAQVRTQQKL